MPGLGLYAQVFGDGHHGGCCAGAAAVDADPDRLAVFDGGVTGARLPGAGGQPGAFEGAPATGVKLGVGGLGDGVALAAQVGRLDPGGRVGALDRPLVFEVFGVRALTTRSRPGRRWR